MDSELMTQLIAFLTAGLTLWQEFRHRKEKKVKAPTVHEGGPVKLSPVKRRK